MITLLLPSRRTTSGRYWLFSISDSTISGTLPMLALPGNSSSSSSGIFSCPRNLITAAPLAVSHVGLIIRHAPQPPAHTDDDQEHPADRSCHVGRPLHLSPSPHARCQPPCCAHHTVCP